VTITAPYEPRAGGSQGRTKSGTLRREARQWRDGLAWSAKLEVLGSSVPLVPPYDVSVHGYYPPRGPAEILPIEHWFDGVASALSDALGVEPTQLRLKPGRIATTPASLPAHLVIVLTTATPGPPAEVRVICPSCGVRWALDPDLRDDRCPSCGMEDAGLPFVLGLL